MTLIIFKYCLPALLGYTLFVGIAGRLNPLRKPHQPEERPSWLLGIWTGLAVSMVLTIGLHMAYGMSLDGAKALAKPSGWLMAGLLAPGFIAYFIYRNSVSSMLMAESKQSFDWALESEDLEFASEIDAGLAHDHPLDRGLEPHILDGIEIPEAEHEVAESFLTSIEMNQIDTTQLAEPINDSGENTPLSTAETSSQIDWTAVDFAPEVEVEVEADAEVKSGVSADEALPEHTEALSSLPSESKPELISAQDLAELQSLFNSEQALREETEKHLRITRKALGTIEAETRHYETRKADAVIKLEDKLTDSLKTQSAMEARATREKTKRVNVETTIVNLKQDLVKAKQEVRRSIAARAKALSTANKSIAFARQNVQIRARLESEIGELQDTLKNRQTTISSLIRALEKEKRRTQDDVAAMATQLVLHEKQVKARRSLEEVAKSVEMKLSTRLVKKVARARPLISDS